MNHFHNTTDEPAHLTGILEGEAKKQDEKILDFFRNNPNVHFAPEQVHMIVQPSAPLTSIRRAITNLAYAGKIVKSDQKRIGSWGRYTHTWYYKTGYSQMKLF
jgi:hypothetical protein